MSKITFSLILFLFPFLLFSQTPEKEKYLDSLGKKYVDSLARLPVTLLGHTIPAFHAYSDNGEFYSNDNFKNKTTYLNFWFESCAPCIAEMEALNDLFSKYREGKDFQFLSITFEKADVIQRIKKEYNIQYPIVSVSQDSCYVINLNSGFPTNIITTSAGKIALYRCGGPLDALKAKAYVVKDIYPILDSLMKR